LIIGIFEEETEAPIHGPKTDVTIFVFLGHRQNCETDNDYESKSYGVNIVNAKTPNGTRQRLLI
jgi:hypothetical protein